MRHDSMSRRQAMSRVDARDRSGAVHRRLGHRSDICGPRLYLAPDGKMAGEAFAVMREGLRGKVGVGTLALYGREYFVAVRPQQKGLVMYTCHHAAEIRSIDAITDLDSVPTEVKPDQVKLAQQVIGTFEGPLDLRDHKDGYRRALSESSTPRSPCRKLSRSSQSPRPRS
jgi:DNA end-binding protein Ku